MWDLRCRCHVLNGTVGTQGLCGSVRTSQTTTGNHCWFKWVHRGRGTEFLLLSPTAHWGPIFPRKGNRFKGISSTQSPPRGQHWSLSLNSKIHTVLIGMHQTIDLVGGKRRGRLKP